MNGSWITLKFSVSTKKTKIICQSSQHSVPSVICSINYNNRPLQSCKSTRFLGIFLDDTLSWKNHINHVCQKIATGIYYILKARHIFPKRILHSLYISFIETHLTYGIESWGTASPSILKPLHILQKRAVRIMHFLPPSTSVSEVFPTSGILHIHQLAYYRLVMFMH